jgi:hypothetical protein
MCNIAAICNNAKICIPSEGFEPKKSLKAID